jgi:hypothetical protein
LNLKFLIIAPSFAGRLRAIASFFFDRNDMLTLSNVSVRVTKQTQQTCISTPAKSFPTTQSSSTSPFTIPKYKSQKTGLDTGVGVTTNFSVDEVIISSQC